MTRKGFYPLLYVLLDPLQGQVLIEKACIDGAFAVYFVGGEEAECSKLALVSDVW